MDFKNDISYRNKQYARYIRTGNNKYDYEKNGILTKALPKILFKGNTVLVTFLQFLDIRIILMFKLIDKIRKFKHITSLY